MNSRILKLSILGLFLLFAGVVFFTSGTSTGAKDRRDEVLEKVRDYKTWKQVTKPPPDDAQGLLSIIESPIQIDQSSIAG